MASKSRNGSRRVEFEGRLTFGNAEKLRNKLAEALGGKSLEISFRNVKEVDLFFLQLLCAALRSARKASCEISVADGPVPAGISRLVKAAGMVSPLERSEDSFWIRLAGEGGLG